MERKETPQDRYHKKMMVQKAFRFHKESDAEILAFLDSQENKADTVRKALKLYMKEIGYTKE